jgi:hypothetical protein
MWLEELGQLKYPVTTLGIEPVPFWLVAYCFNQLCYSIPHLYSYQMFLESMKTVRLTGHIACMKEMKNTYISWKTEELTSKM